MNFQKSMLLLHRYLGLVATVPLVLLALSGAVLVFEVELDRALNPRHWAVTPQGTQVSWQDAIDNVRKAYPGDAAGSLRMPPAPDKAAEVSLKSGLMVSVDPYTGRVMDARRREQIFTAKIHQFHTRFLAGPWGEKATGVSTLLLLVLSGTGIYLWWRRKTFGVRWTAPWRRVVFDSHYALGLYGLLPWALLGLTGTAMAFESIVRPALYTVTRTQQAAAPPLRSPWPPGANPLTPDAALVACRSVLPGAAVTVLSLPKDRRGVFLAYMKFPEDRTPAGRSRVGIDQFNGSVVWLENARTSPTGTRLWNLNRPVHTGDILGWPTRLLACAACLALAVQAASGVWLWCARPWRRGE